MLSHRKRKPIGPRAGSILPEPEPIYRHSYSEQPQTNFFEEGDQVQHKIMDYLNSGLPLKVLDTDGRKVLCSYIDDVAKTPAIAWYEAADLKLISSANENDFMES